jgi:hypothetical protein
MPFVHLERERPCGIEELELGHGTDRDHPAGELVCPGLADLALQDPEQRAVSIR